MALPADLTGSTSPPIEGWFGGPFKSSAGNFYGLTRFSNATVGMWKTADPTTTDFTEQDGANRPSVVSGLHCVSCVQDGDDIHVIMQETEAGAGTERVFYSRFDMASDIWDDIDGAGDRDVLIHTADPTGVTERQSVGIEVRSDGDVVAVFNKRRNKFMGVDRNTIGVSVSTDSGVNWSAVVEVSGGGANDYNSAAVTIPPNNSDQAHIFYINDATATLFQRAFSNADVLRTERDTGFGASTASTFHTGIGRVLSFDRSGTSKVRTFYAGENKDLFVYEMDAFSDDTDPTASDSRTNIDSTNDVYGAAAQLANISAAVDSATAHCMWVRDADRDIYRDDDEGTDTWNSVTSEKTGTINSVSANSYVRAGNRRLAYLWWESPNVTKYDEVDLGPAVTEKTITTSLDAAVQQQKTLTASLEAALQQEFTRAASLDGTVQEEKLRTASLEAAIEQLKTATASLDGAIQDGKLPTASLNAGIAAQQTRTSSLDAALAAALGQTANLDAVLRALKTVQANLDAAVRDTLSQETGLDAAVQSGTTATTSLNAIVQAEKSVATALDAAVVQIMSLTANLDAVISGGATTLITNLDAAVASVNMIVANLSAAVQALKSVSTSLDAAVIATGLTSASVDAAVVAALEKTAALDAAVQAEFLRQTGLDVALEAVQTAQVSIDAGVARTASLALTINAAISRVSLIQAGLDAALQTTLTTGASLDAVLGAQGFPAASRTHKVAARSDCTILPDGRIYVIPKGSRMH